MTLLTLTGSKVTERRLKDTIKMATEKHEGENAENPGWPSGVGRCHSQ